MSVQFYDGNPIGADVPAHVELRVTETDPGFKGDTATGTTKPAKLETGTTVQVPLFVNPGDVVRIDYARPPLHRQGVALEPGATGQGVKRPRDPLAAGSFSCAGFVRSQSPWSLSLVAAAIGIALYFAPAQTLPNANRVMDFVVVNEAMLWADDSDWLRTPALHFPDRQQPNPHLKLVAIDEDSMQRSGRFRGRARRTVSC